MGRSGVARCGQVEQKSEGILPLRGFIKEGPRRPSAARFSCYRRISANFQRTVPPIGRRTTRVLLPRFFDLFFLLIAFKIEVKNDKRGEGLDARNGQLLETIKGVQNSAEILSLQEKFGAEQV